MSVSVATRDLLRWISDHRASYQEAFEVWQTSCPRSSVWEDAFIDGLVAVEREAATDDGAVVLTGLGRQVLEGGA